MTASSACKSTQDAWNRSKKATRRTTISFVLNEASRTISSAISLPSAASRTDDALGVADLSFWFRILHRSNQRPDDTRDAT
jgi:hypothetical protein